VLDTSSPVQQWADARADALLARLADAARWRSAHQPFSGADRASGRIAVHVGPCVVVDVRLTLPSAGIDSLMLHAFAPSSTASPHFLSDLAVLADGTWHFHVDLVPRVDAVHEPASLEAQAPMTGWADHAYALPGAAPIAIPRRLRALSSPWLVGVIVDEQQVDELTAIHEAYAGRFHELLAAPLATAMSAEGLVQRDRAHRAALFDDATDPVWSFLAEHVGQEPVDRILALVRGTAADPATVIG
jgi:hypothetical protein